MGLGAQFLVYVPFQRGIRLCGHVDIKLEKNISWQLPTKGVHISGQVKHVENSLHTHTHTHTHRCTCPHKCIQAPIVTHTQFQTHTHTFAHNKTFAHKCIHTYISAHTHTLTRKHTCPHKCIPAHTLRHKHTHTHISLQ